MNKYDTKKTGNTPVIYPGSLTDEELINFLEELAVDLKSRSRLIGKPEQLREEANIAEEKLTTMNDAIDLIVCRKIQAPTQILESSDIHHEQNENRGY